MPGVISECALGQPVILHAIIFVLQRKGQKGKESSPSRSAPEYSLDVSSFVLDLHHAEGTLPCRFQN